MYHLLPKISSDCWEYTEDNPLGIVTTVSEVCHGGHLCNRSAHLVYDFYSNYRASCVHRRALNINKITRTTIEFPGVYTARLGTHTLAANDDAKYQLLFSSTWSGRAACHPRGSH